MKEKTDSIHQGGERRFRKFLVFVRNKEKIPPNTINQVSKRGITITEGKRTRKGQRNEDGNLRK